MKHTLLPHSATTHTDARLYQKQMGAYYTQEDITHYIARNTILPYFFSQIESDASFWQLLQAHPEHYISTTLQTPDLLPAETASEYTARQARYQHVCHALTAGMLHSINDLITYNLDIQRLAQDTVASCDEPTTLLRYYQQLEHITILDPTCGTGAFLLAALHVLKPLYHICLNRMRTLLAASAPCSHAIQSLLAAVEQQPNQAYVVVHTILTKNLYGVDIMSEAVHDCRHMLSLQLYACTDKREDGIQLPDLARHICVGNALIDFDWHTAFSEVITQGGFAVCIGNPPYVEFSRVRQEYQKAEQEQEQKNNMARLVRCGNLYAAVIERVLTLCCPKQSYLGFIVPVSICSSERFQKLRATLTSTSEQLWVANFDIFPSRLFDGAFQRLSILFAQRAAHTATRTHMPSAINVTRLQRWYAVERFHLLDLITFTPMHYTSKPTVFPKLAAPLQEDILSKLAQHACGSSIGTLLQPHKTAHFVYYQEATNYWMKATCHIPFYRKNGVVMEPPHGRLLFFEDTPTAQNIMAIMHSSLFYLWFATYSDGFHLSHALVKAFPLSRNLLSHPALPQLAQHLEADIQHHARRSTRNTKPDKNTGKAGDRIELAEYRMVYSKPLLDEIDATLATYYGFTSEELTFIISYDSKYRMGRDHN